MLDFLLDVGNIYVYLDIFMLYKNKNKTKHYLLSSEFRKAETVVKHVVMPQFYSSHAEVSTIAHRVENAEMSTCQRLKQGLSR